MKSNEIYFLIFFCLTIFTSCQIEISDDNAYIGYIAELREKNADIALEIESNRKNILELRSRLLSIIIGEAELNRLMQSLIKLLEAIHDNESYDKEIGMIEEGISKTQKIVESASIEKNILEKQINDMKKEDNTLNEKPGISKNNNLNSELYKLQEKLFDINSIHKEAIEVLTELQSELDIRIQNYLHINGNQAQKIDETVFNYLKEYLKIFLSKLYIKSQIDLLIKNIERILNRAKMNKKT